MSPRIVTKQGVWEPCSGPRTSLRKFGVPPGGFWDASFPLAYHSLGQPVLQGTAASPGSGTALSLVSRQRLAWLIMGSPGTIRCGRHEAQVPCIWVGEGSADLTSEGGGRWSLACLETRSPDLLRRLDSPQTELADEIRVIPLPGFDGVLSEGRWVVSPSSSRIGIRLLGALPEMGVLEASHPSSPGVIQASGSGELLVHGPDGPTTGGYPQLGAVIKADLGRLSVLPAGTGLRFAAVTRYEASAAWTERVLQAEKLSDTLAKLKRLGLV